MPSFRSLWRNRPDLKHLQIGGVLREITGFDINFDAEFCGIFLEEAELLRQKDEDYLKTVNIFTPFPAINNLKNLKKLEITLGMMDNLESAHDNDGAGAVPDGIFFLSKVTQLVAMRHMNPFKFRLIATPKIAKHLEHLTQWADVEVQEDL